MSNKSSKRSQCNIKTVVHISREFGELAGAGGIKDVTEGLSKATASAGIHTHVFLPFYRDIKGKVNLTPSLTFDIAMNYPGKKRNESVTIYTVSLMPTLTLYLIEAKRYNYLDEEDISIERHGIYTYTKEEATALGQPKLEGKGYSDFFAMNALLVKATLHVLGSLQIKPDIIHCHDGHAALLPFISQTSEDDFAPFLRYVPSLITIHNAGKGYHQEIADLDFATAICGVQRDLINSCLLDKNFDPLLAGGLFGTAINTVSENYARELQCTGQDWMTGWLGHAFASYGIRLEGITNGVDPKAQLLHDWTELNSKESFKKEILEEIKRGDVPNKITLIGKIGYKENIPLLTFIGRLDEQKGFDILSQAVDLLFAEDHDVQLLGLGDGSPHIVAQYEKLVENYNGRVCIAKGYSPILAKKIYAAGDFFIVPSRFEPCGLTDFFAQLVGSLPIVHSVGGLVKILDGRFGFSYIGGAQELYKTFKRALNIYREPNKSTLQKMQNDALRNIYDNFTWDKVLEKKYLPFYKNIITKTEPVLPY